MGEAGGQEGDRALGWCKIFYYKDFDFYGEMGNH